MLSEYQMVAIIVIVSLLVAFTFIILAFDNAFRAWSEAFKAWCETDFKKHEMLGREEAVKEWLEAHGDDQKEEEK